MADLAASMPELAKILAVHLRLAWTVFKANEAVVFEANEAVVLEANEAVILEANKAVVFEVRTHCRLVQRCGRETEGSSRTGFRG
jgi:hypothetical protein